jgi:hypothetical protein
MEERDIDVIEQEILQKKQEIEDKKQKQELAVSNSSQTELQLSNTINDKLETIFQESVENNTGGVRELADKAVKNELEIKNEQLESRKEVEKSKSRKGVTEAKTEEDKAKHTRSQTILKSQGLVNQLPAPYRITAMIIGYPFFILYLLTFGWIIQMLTFVIKGFITMVADCAERFADVNKKFVENNNNKEFKLGKAMINILKWLLVIGAITTVVVLFVLK